MVKKKTVAPASPRGSKSGGKGARANIRMYRQGFGDCFLITLPRKTSGAYRILIDCGVLLGTDDAEAKMIRVAEDIVKVSGGHIDIVVATHQHWDHLSGFIQASDIFAKLTVGEVWVAWTEDPRDDLANELRQERAQALTALRMSAAAMTMAGDTAGASEIDNLLGFYGATRGASTADALDAVMKMGKLRFCRPADEPTQLKDAAAKVYVLGPPHDAKLIRKTLPSARDPDTYGVAANQLSDNVTAALLPNDAATPFSDLRAIPLALTRGMEFFRAHYWGPGEDAPDWRRIDTAWLDGASELALALDGATNNTSLVLAIELKGGDVLLFVADAQVGNWISWGDLSWKVGGDEMTGPDLLARTIFYKVGHHGSSNATLRANGLAMMKNLSIAAIPVDHQMALRKGWDRIPLQELTEALKSTAKTGVIRSDETPSRAITGVSATDLYFDISI
ncbi:MBL fold metallo-hydrolase [Phyllobacterium sp. SYP-B3895]|uniref:MBL fold metallo-hydrolase n=1 Tax=Phyllobacterium sp. SYP-B3895 TaxID=2663240 RepID=UPI001299EB4B|nr:MBL fold metallo-hydrolase [Phyllobacterium sp. SYP-B3895]MRG58160.1 MBL fold metallo-hydrolase [Phyllobacterium sp. SYP-B3895]